MLCHPKRGHCPTLIAPITSLDDAVVGIHRTYLQPSGLKLDVPNPRRTLGQARGHAIRLGEPCGKLIICEGLEDGLTLYQMLGRHAVWVAGGAGMLAVMMIPDRVHMLTIAADNDSAGEQAARRAADTHGIQGRDVKIMRPNPAFKDFNDQLRGIENGQ